MEDCVNDRSVMHFDAMASRMLLRNNQRFKLLRELNYYVNLHRKGDCSLEFMVFNEECLVSVCHYLTLNKFLPFVHTARRSYRCKDW